MQEIRAFFLRLALVPRLIALAVAHVVVFVLCFCIAALVFATVVLWPAPFGIYAFFAFFAMTCFEGMALIPRLFVLAVPLPVYFWVLEELRSGYPEQSADDHYLILVAYVPYLTGAAIGWTRSVWKASRSE